MGYTVRLSFRNGEGEFLQGQAYGGESAAELLRAGLIVESVDPEFVPPPVEAPAPKKPKGKKPEAEG